MHWAVCALNKKPLAEGARESCNAGFCLSRLEPGSCTPSEGSPFLMSTQVHMLARTMLRASAQAAPLSLLFPTQLHNSLTFYSVLCSDVIREAVPATLPSCPNTSPSFILLPRTYYHPICHTLMYVLVTTYLLPLE